MRIRGFADDAPASAEEEAEHLARALAESAAESSSAEGVAAPPSVSESAASSGSAAPVVINFIASTQVVYISGSAPATPPTQEPEAEPADRRGSDKRAISFSGVEVSRAQANARRLVGEERLRRAHRAGLFAARKARGEIVRVPATPQVTGPAADKWLFVLIRGLPNLGQRGLAPFRYQQFKGYVEVDGVIEPSCVFHGFASQAEALEYWQAVYHDLPWPLLPPRP